MSEQTRTLDPARIPVAEVARRAGKLRQGVMHRRHVGVIGDREGGEHLEDREDYGLGYRLSMMVRQGRYSHPSCEDLEGA